MNIRAITGLLAFAASLLATTALANHVTLSGTFTGDEPAIQRFSGTCTESTDPLGYLKLGPVTVSTSGYYDIVDAGNWIPEAVDVVIRFYAGSFDPADISANLVANSIDEADQFNLSAGTQYYVVIQHWCVEHAGTYGVAISGAGTVSGTGVVNSPNYTLGQFSSSDPKADFIFAGYDYTGSVYDKNGPIQVPVSGAYYYADLSEPRRTDMILYIYQGSFNPADTTQNIVTATDDIGVFNLQAGVDYFFVTIPYEDNEYGEWHYTLFPPGKVVLNGFLSGSWYNPATEGQGIMMEVFPNINVLFFVWFTFEQQAEAQALQSASGSKTESVGAPDQRWFAAVGEYQDGASSVDLSFENVTGSVFNVKLPTQERDESYGTGRLTANGCNDITLEFDLPAGPASGSNELERVYPDPITMEFCQLVGASPGVIE